VGDMRDEFALHTLFPDIAFVRLAVKVVGAICYQACLRMGLLQASLRRSPLPRHHTGDSSSSSSSSAFVSHPRPYVTSPRPESGHLNGSKEAFGFRPVDPIQERRRALAMKAIDDKLAELSQDSAFTSGFSYSATPLPTSSFMPVPSTITVSHVPVHTIPAPLVSSSSSPPAQAEVSSSASSSHEHAV